MKRLNRKGFTLIELLAIIVILAIIMVVTIPTVLKSMGSARYNTFQTSANTVADWMEKQYTLYKIQDADATFSNFCSTNSGACTIASGATKSTEATISNNVLAAAGVDSSNYSSAKVYFQSNGRACVTLTASTNGDFANAQDDTGADVDSVTSIGCNAS